MSHTARLITRAATAALVAFPLTVAYAQPTSQSLSIGGNALATPSPLILRSDAPPAGSGGVDPSLANAYDFTTPTGINLNGVANYIVPDPDDPRFIFSCTASRIGVRALLTAAHCVTDDNTGALLSTADQSFARFLAPGSTNASQVWYYTPDASQVIVNPLWMGFSNPSTYLGTDLAVVTFSSDLPSWIPTYGLFTDVPLGDAVTLAGFGTFGGGVGATNFDFGRRWGTNEVDYINPDPSFNDYLELYTDFDDPKGKFDTFCFVGIVCNTGVFTEAATGEGDSGGPLFVDGRIAGVTSFGTYICDPTLSTATTCVPRTADPSRPFDSFGSLNGFAPVFANLDFIETAITPEPSTFVLLATGLFVFGAKVRRRQQRRVM